MNRARYFSLFILILLCMLGSDASAHLIPRPTDLVSDFAGVLTQEEETILMEYAQSLLDDTGSELAIVIVKKAMEPGEEFIPVAIKYLNEQKIGQKGNDNGVLVLLATEDRMIGIFPGTGLEGALPEYLTKEIIDTKAKPHLSPGEERWGFAVIQIVAEIDPYIRGEEFADPGSCCSGCWVGAGIWGVVIASFIAIGFASRVRCPVCKSKVKLKETKIVLAATKNHGGLEKRFYECTVCKHEFVRSVTLPAKGKKSSGGGGWGSGSSSSGGWSSSSSSSSFGGFSGGSSSGGGSASSF